MVKLSELATAAEVHDRDMTDPEYQREYDRAALANEVALKVVSYRTEHGLSQAALARKLGMRQPNIARLEAGDHEPSLSTLARLSLGLGMDFSVDIRRGRLQLRRPQAGFSRHAAASRS